MTPAIGLLVIGGILLVAGWKNRPVLDVALGRETERGQGGVSDASGVASSPGGVPGGQLGPPLAPTKGTTKFQGKVVAGWIAPILQWARNHGWTGHVESGFRTYQEQKDIYNSGVRPAARPGFSNHEGSQFPRGAVDIDRVSAPALARILRASPYRDTLVWAGAKDPVHFSHPHGGSY